MINPITCKKLENSWQVVFSREKNLNMRILIAQIDRRNIRDFMWKSYRSKPEDLRKHTKNVAVFLGLNVVETDR